jgi:hypothetical protein
MSLLRHGWTAGDFLPLIEIGAGRGTSFGFQLPLVGQYGIAVMQRGPKRNDGSLGCIKRQRIDLVTRTRWDHRLPLVPEQASVPAV